jgi:hypothetical protein
LVVIPASGKSGRQIVPYNLTPRRKLGRYVLAVAQALVSGGRLPDTYAAKRWVDGLHWPLWEALTGLGILQWAGAKISEHVPYGLPIDSFTLQPLDDMVHRCRSCAYIMSETLFDVCVRCGQCTQTVETVELRNFYRLAALHALPGSLFDDPYRSARRSTRPRSAAMRRAMRSAGSRIFPRRSKPPRPSSRYSFCHDDDGNGHRHRKPPVRGSAQRAADRRQLPTAGGPRRPPW